MCCDNPTDLGCISQCDLLILPIAVTDLYTVKTTFNGAVLDLDFAINDANDYAVVSQTDLNENYSYTIGVYNASGTNVGCYKVRIEPSGACCEPSTDVSQTRILADYATLNSDTFLSNYTVQNKKYGYRCIAAKFNGVSLATGEAMTFENSQLDIAKVPVQVAPRDTIPEHDTDNSNLNLQYDRNWITFLNSLPIADYLTFRVSPFSGSSQINPLGKDRDFPDAIMGAQQAPGNDLNLYGEGFQIERNYPSTFSFTIQYLYFDDFVTEQIGHTIVFTESGYWIDGAKVFPANMRIIKTT